MRSWLKAAAAVVMAMAGAGMAWGQSAPAPRPVVLQPMFVDGELYIKATAGIWGWDPVAAKHVCREVLALCGGNGEGAPSVSAASEPSPIPGIQNSLPSLLDGWAYVRLAKDPALLAAARKEIDDANRARDGIDDLDRMLADLVGLADATDPERAKIEGFRANLRLQREVLGRHIAEAEAQIDSPVSIRIDTSAWDESAAAAGDPGDGQAEAAAMTVWYPMIVARWVRAGARGTDILVRTGMDGNNPTIDVAVITEDAEVEFTVAGGAPDTLDPGNYLTITRVPKPTGGYCYEATEEAPITGSSGGLDALRAAIFATLAAHPDVIFPEPTNPAP